MDHGMNPPIEHFAIGTALDKMVNIEYIVTDPPHVLPNYGGLPMRLQGMTGQRAANGRLRQNGALIGRWAFDSLVSQDGWESLRRHIELANPQYVITLDGNGDWSPYLAYVDMPVMGETLNTFNTIPHDAVVTLFGGVLQYATKSANYTVTTSDHLIYVSGTTGNITLTLPALISVARFVPFRFVNQGGYSVVLDGNSSETIDGSSTLTIARNNLLTDGDMEAATTAAWSAGNNATLSKQTGTPHGGSRVLRVQRNVTTTPYAYQNVLTPGQRYHITGYMRSDGSATPYIYHDNLIKYGTTSTSWQAIDATFVAGNTSLWLVCSTTGDTQWVEFDDMVLTSEAEPYPMATLVRGSGSEWTQIA